MNIKIKSEFSPAELEYMHQQMQEVTDFFAGTGEIIVSKSLSRKGKMKIKLLIKESESSLKFIATGNSLVECLTKMQKEWNQVFASLTDEVVSNAQRVSEINSVLKDSKIH